MKQDAENDKKSVSIKAKYPFGTVDIETVEVQPLDLIESVPEVKSKSSIPTKAIKTSVVSEVAVIGNERCYDFFCLNLLKNLVLFTETVLDSIDAGDFGEMCLHRKIAPYQCIVYSLCQGLEIENRSKWIYYLMQFS